MNNIYHEIHVIIEPEGSSLNLVDLDLLCYNTQFWYSILNEDTKEPQEDEPGDFICTNRAETFLESVQKIKGFVHWAKKYGFRVKRYKVELALLDSKFTDELALLGKEACRISS